MGAQRARGVALTVAIGAATLTLAGLGAAAQQAQAFAWKDTCTINVVNRTGSQGNVRPIALVQFPPNTIAYAKYLALAATGFPNNASIGFSTTGIPLTAGCSETLFLNNPGSNVQCAAIAPTVGPNTFTCNGNSSFRIQTDNDDIEGTVFIPQSTGSPAAGVASVSKTRQGGPKIGQGVLKRTALPGRGWAKTRKVSALGRFGMLFDRSRPSGPCRNANDNRAPVAVTGGASLFVRGHGAQAIGELDGRYARVHAAKTTLATATSDRSIRCLAQSLTAAGYRVTSAAGPDVGKPGIVSKRVVVRKLDGGWKGYVDVVGLLEGRSNSVVLFFNAGEPAKVSNEASVIAAVVGRLNRRVGA